MNQKPISNAAGLETRHIFFDTQVYRAYGHDLGSGPLEIIADYIAEGVFILHTTDITLKEVSAQLDFMQTELILQANRYSQRLDRWNKKLHHQVDYLTVPKALNLPVSPTIAYRDFERKLLHEWNAERHEAANLSMGLVLNQYFLRQAPFDKDGSKEFPDAMALLALEAWCQQSMEKCYVVSKDKAVQRAANHSNHLIAIDSLDNLLSHLTSAQSYGIAKEIEGALSKPSLLGLLESTVSKNMLYLGGIYAGDRMDGEIQSIEFLALDEISSVTVLRVDIAKVACVLGIKIDVSAEVSFDDTSEAIWDSEDGRYYGVKSGWADAENTVTVKLFVEFARDDNEFVLEDFQFITRDLIIRDDDSDGYPYK